MDALSTIAFLVFALVGKNYYNKLKKQISLLEEELYKTRSLLNELNSEKIFNKVKKINEEKIEPSELPPEIPINIEPQNIAIQASAPQKIIPQQYIVPVTEVPKNKLPENNAMWKKVEAQFAGNLIGVIGTIAMILGVIFLAVYAAIQTGPVGRFGVVCAFSIALYCIHIFLKKREFWRNISLWLRSASGIIFLVGCLGSIGFESMKWVNDPGMALALLSFGLIVNLIMGFLNGGQMFASIHVLLSLLALVIVPLNPTIFFVSAIISTVGILMSYKDKMWDKHIIATSVGFFLIHSYWLSSSTSFPVSDATAIGFCSLVGLAGILTHYRKIYKIDKINTVALLAHLVTWGTLGVNLYAHSKGSNLSTLALALASISIFFLSAKAKKHSVGWLLTSDRLISLLLVLMATMSLSKFGLSNFDVSVIGAIISVLFVRLISQSADPLLEKIVFNISCAISRLAYFIIAVQACLIAFGGAHGGGGSSIGMIILSFIILSVVFPAIEKRAIENSWGFDLTLNKKTSYSTYLGISLGMHGALATLLSLQMNEQPWFLFAPIVIMLVAFILRGFFKNYLFDISSILGAFLILILCSIGLFNNSLAITYKLNLFFLMLGISLILLFYNWIDDLREKVVWPGVLGLWGSISLGVYIFTRDQYPMLTGIIWLIMAMLASGIKKTTLDRITGTGVHERFESFVALAGIASIFIFIERFFVFDIQSELWIGPIRIRALIELFSLIVIVYWWFDSRKSTPSTTSRFLNYFLELFLVLAFVFSLYEIDNMYLSLVWVIFSLISIFLSMKMVELNRLIIYSLFLYVFSLFHVGFMSSALVTPSIHINDQSWFVAIITICINISYLIFVLQQKVFSRSLMFPEELKVFSAMLNWFKINDAKVLMYPLLTSVAFFLVWSFSNSILSLLLIVECFILFLVSILLREPDFRIISMAGISVIFWRIIFYDLTGKDFFIKAIVFISVGAILIVMNAIYNKYKYRYEPVKID